MGQTRYAKAVIVNELFHQNLLPLDTEEDSPENSWRMIRFKYGLQTNLTLHLSDADFEVMEKLAAYEKPGWKEIPAEDLVYSESEKIDPANRAAEMEVSLQHQLLRDGVRLVVTPCQHVVDVEDVFRKATAGVLPVLLYALHHDQLPSADVQQLQELRRLAPSQPVFFVRVPSTVAAYKSYCDQKSAAQGRVPLKTQFVRQQSVNIVQDLCQLGFMAFLPRGPPTARRLAHLDLSNMSIDSEVAEHFDTDFPKVTLFTRRVLQNYLIRASAVLNKNHIDCLGKFISTAFDLARDVMMTPKRIEFVRKTESYLFDSLLKVAQGNQEKVRSLIGETLVDMRETLLLAAADYKFIGLDNENKLSPKPTSARVLKMCTAEIRELVLKKLNEAISKRLVEEINILREAYTGTLRRCVRNLDCGGDGVTVNYSSSHQATLHTEDTETQEECEDTYEVTEDTVDIEDNKEQLFLSSDNGQNHNSATVALKMILSSAYEVEITLKTGSSFVQSLLEKMKELLASMPWAGSPTLDSNWRSRVAADMLDSLSDHRLARHLCEQFSERLRSSHERFSAAMRRLEDRISTRTAAYEDQRDKIRRLYAPRLARLALESVSIRDMILFGMPQLGREIGRGQYGVVYACDSWAGGGPMAIKSVVPPDDKHWNDLALEFYYTKNLPEHDRIVAIRGSVIDYTYGGASEASAVYLLMDRLHRDLYLAIKQGLDWPGRLQVALDVVEGIRYLHSQGLVHRDIKLKNVLLDKDNRGKLTDLGFCKPHAMMSGSVVGTPIHMAPELFSGRYDASVDVYAFGILFWYVCSGNTRLPYNFEQCNTKDILWSSVKKGIRPERLPNFSQKCWDLMQSCWHGNPVRRPLPGFIEPALEEIRVTTSIDPTAPKSKSLSNLLNTQI